MANTRSTRWLESSVQADAASNDSDKTFTVPAGESWRVLCVHVNLAATATVGNRQLEVRATDESDNVLAIASAGAVQAASATRIYTLAPGLADLTSFRDTDKMTTPLPPLVLAAGHKLRVFDKTAVDATADDMTVRVLVERLKE